MRIGQYTSLLNPKIGFSFQPGKFQIFKSNLDFGQDWSKTILRFWSGNFFPVGIQN